MEEKKKSGLRWSPSHTVAVVTLTSAAILWLSYARTEGPRSWPSLIPAFSLFVGFSAGVFQIKNLRFLLAGLMLGFVLGASSSLDLFGEPVEGLYQVTAATMIVFAILGLLVGAFAEFVAFLHGLTHRHGQKEPPSAAPPA